MSLCYNDFIIFRMDGRRSLAPITKEAALIEELLEKSKDLEDDNEKLREELTQVKKKKEILERKLEKIEKCDLYKKCEGLKEDLKVGMYTCI